jgi:serine/threonine-protein kinase
MRTDLAASPPQASTLPSAGSKGGPLEPGIVLDQRYLVEGVLGTGGMAYVVAARHLELQHRVAIKLTLPGKTSEQGRLRMVREARTAAQIKSDHVVRVLDVVSSGPNAPYIVMEYLRGETLAHRLGSKEKLQIKDVVEILLQTCEAVGEAHHLGMVHRDLKPSNLFLVAKPGNTWSAKVLDFGITKTIESIAQRLTHSHAMLASPAYAPPEQLRASSDVDLRADIWSLGVIAYECLTGSLPFRGDSLPDVCAQVLQNTPVPPRQLRSEIPIALERVILRCLEKDLARRYASIEELVLALDQFAPSPARKCLTYLRGLDHASDSTRWPPREEPPRETPGGATLTATSATRVATTGSGRRRGRVWTAFMAVVGAALAIVGGHAWLSRPVAPSAVESAAVDPAPRAPMTTSIPASPRLGAPAVQTSIPMSPRVVAAPPTVEPVTSASPPAVVSRRVAKRPAGGDRAGTAQSAAPTIGTTGPAPTHEVPWVDSR